MPCIVARMVAKLQGAWTRLQRIQNARHGTCQHQKSFEPRIAVLQQPLLFGKRQRQFEILKAMSSHGLPVDEVGDGVAKVSVRADVEQKQVNGFHEDNHSVR
jgi:hypothetical protein